MQHDYTYVSAHMREVTSTTAATSPSPAATEEERYVKVASRFFRVKPAGGGGAMTRLHYLESCFLCKRNIPCSRDIFMYKGDAAFCSEDCRQEQMDLDEALDAVARRHRRLLHHKPPSSELAGTARREAATAAAMTMHRRPTIANLAARTPVAAS